MILSLLRRIARSGPNAEETLSPSERAPDLVLVDERWQFPLAQQMEVQDGFPVLDWDSVLAWLESLPDEQIKAKAWALCERGWLLHLRDALGEEFRLDESANAIVLSSLEPKLSRYTLEFMERTLKRILHVLAGVAESPAWGKDLLIVFDDADDYYRYASWYYPERGEFAYSSGMHISRGCAHYITTKADLHAVEPVIAHEMTHGCLGHLPLPLWLNEGLAVNTERRIVPPGAAQFSPREIHEKQLAFWGESEIQEFWSGRSFQRPDEANMLSYELARLIVEQLSRDWARFAAFVNAASFEDAGSKAASAHLGVTLGVVVAALLERTNPDAWDPQPSRWDIAPDNAPAINQIR